MLMARRARIVVPDIRHHISQRGNNRQDNILVDDDRITYLNIQHPTGNFQLPTADYAEKSGSRRISFGFLSLSF